MTKVQLTANIKKLMKELGLKDGIYEYQRYSFYAEGNGFRYIVYERMPPNGDTNEVSNTLVTSYDELKRWYDMLRERYLKQERDKAFKRLNREADKQALTRIGL